MAKTKKATALFNDVFRLVKTGPYTSYVAITKNEVVVIEHSADVSQETLQKVYDAGPQYKKIIEAPAGYKAPWQ
jgi:hypothetical protein